MVNRMKPKDRFVFIPGFQTVKMLASPGESISATLPLVGAHLYPTLVTPQVITHTFLPAVSLTFTLPGKALFPTTLASWPRVGSPKLLLQGDTPLPTILNLTLRSWLFSASFSMILLTSSFPGVCGIKRGTSYPPFLNHNFSAISLLLCLPFSSHERGAFIGRPPLLHHLVKALHDGLDHLVTALLVIPRQFLMMNCFDAAKSCGFAALGTLCVAQESGWHGCRAVGAASWKAGKLNKIHPEIESQSNSQHLR